MRFAVASLILLIFLAGFSSAQNRQAGWKVDGKRVEDAANHKAVEGFGAHLIVIRDPGGFITMWHRPEKPNFKPAEVVGFGESIGVIVLFAGCKPNNEGYCNTEVDYRVYDPKQNLLIERKNLKLWKQKAPPVKNTHLGEAVLGFSTKRILAAGMYKVQAKVYDLNADISFDLETQFELR